jgi:hypothetical protein
MLNLRKMRFNKFGDENITTEEAQQVYNHINLRNWKIHNRKFLKELKDLDLHLKKMKNKKFYKGVKDLKMYFNILFKELPP